MKKIGDCFALGNSMASRIIENSRFKIQDVKPCSCCTESSLSRYANFVIAMEALIDDDKELSEIPSLQRRPKPKSLAHHVNNTNSRNDAIVIAYAGGGYIHHSQWHR
ncbi:MAG: hypothetical protein ACI8XV_001840 [Arenicella sp.]|jgi:hypothetical protein